MTTTERSIRRRQRAARSTGVLRCATPARVAASALALLAAMAMGAHDARADEAARLYSTLCASCHGVGGHGDGPAADALSPRPSDLTKSTLNVPELMRVIDGRRTVRAHGDAAMPVWGRTFEQAMEGSGREHRDALRQVQMLAEYVRSLQKPAS